MKDLTMHDLFKHRRKEKGDIGLEIEVEGRNVELFGHLPRDNWRVERDGSLRNGGVELVLNKPLSRVGVIRALKEVNDFEKQNGVRVEDNGRAGVHVHINMQNYTVTQVYNFICAYMIFEDQLTEFCGDHRSGNLFCLRVRDAEDIIDHLVHILQSKQWNEFNSNHYRYAAMNVTSLYKYGSLEFRAMRSTTDKDVLLQWIDTLLAIRDWSAKFNNPEELVMSLSHEGCDKTFNDVFGNNPAIAYDEDAMMDGIRQAQIIAFCGYDWQYDMYEEFTDIKRKVGTDWYPHTRQLSKFNTRGMFKENYNGEYVDYLRHYMNHAKNRLEKEVEERRRPRRFPKHPQPIHQPEDRVQNLGQVIIDKAAGLVADGAQDIVDRDLQRIREKLIQRDDLNRIRREAGLDPWEPVFHNDLVAELVPKGRDRG